MKMRFWTISTLVAMFSLSACATSTSVVDTRPREDVEADTLDTAFDEDYALIDYAATRSKIGDVIHSVNNPYPEEFARTKGQSTGSSTSRQGFRVQILSTQNRVEAENMLEEYNLWLAGQSFDYKAFGYIVFQSPNYRVHVGDFQDRESAQQFSRRIKDRFSDAWVVADTIDPERVPRR